MSRSGRRGGGLFFRVFRRGLAVVLLEHGGEVGLVTEADAVGYLRDVCLAFAQEPLRLLHAKPLLYPEKRVKKGKMYHLPVKMLHFYNFMIRTPACEFVNYHNR